MLKYGEGDLMALKQDLKAALQLPESEISINSVTNHIVIRVSRFFAFSYHAGAVRRLHT